ncbi:Rho GTPase-activating protein, putative [Entamoeba invadens IP1]|uniref:Rho GTPase-activating protein, putative n=1 Tax=Entamoeba invadens IP1 TaxID=370355 RepID=A0A0A1TXS5_ENTIV|nr:Rho GTPase-activating protein, putative [Entamoeba invadens IP1]ELP86175.1 Rho GTPase-activating protein, putative [Entamoeba invadens IP1]|eukprot:XP_004185521.1 Rho GTPase-activating protein, putative [Entamoeba invadens IP1]
MSRVSDSRVVSILCNKKIKDMRVELIPDPTFPILYINKKTIQVIRAFITLSVNKTLFPKDYKPSEADPEQANMFEIIYDHEYIFICKTHAEMKYWVAQLSPYMKAFGVFQYPIEVAIKKSRWRVPNVVYRCIEFMQKKNADQLEGIFRINANSRKIRELRELVENDADLKFDEKDEISTASSFLKQYLHVLVVPLIPPEWFHDYINMPSGLPNPREFVNSLPKHNQNTLWYFCEFLHQIILKKDINKMDETNLAKCVGLVVCENPQNGKMNELVYTKTAISTFEYLLRNHETAFCDVKKRNEELGVQPPSYPAFQPLNHPQYDLLTEQIKMELGDCKKQWRLSASFLGSSGGKKVSRASFSSISLDFSKQKNDLFSTSMKDLSNSPKSKVSRKERAKTMLAKKDGGRLKINSLTAGEGVRVLTSSSEIKDDSSRGIVVSELTQ